MLKKIGEFSEYSSFYLSVDVLFCLFGVKLTEQ